MAGYLLQVNMQIVYDRPPLVETLCELRFQSAEPWNLTVPGRLYERIRDQYPKMRQERTLEITTADQNVVDIPRIQFIRKDEQALLQVGPDLLVMNQLRPYPGWESFKGRVLHDLALYREVVVPARLRQISLRVINRIDLPDASFDWGDYFHCRPLPPLPREEHPAHAGVLLRLDLAYKTSPPGRLEATLASIEPAEPNGASFMLELGMSSAEVVPNIDQMDEWLDAYHERIEKVFYAFFTDKTHHQLFQERP